MWKKNLAPKKLLTKREEPRARTHHNIKAQTIFEPKPEEVSVDYHMPIVNEDMFVAMQLELAVAAPMPPARELQPIPYTKKDQYGAQYYRAWAPVLKG